MAEREAAKAAEEMRRLKEQREKQKSVMEEFHKPPDRTPEQVMEVVIQLVNRAAERGLSEVQVYRFPNSLCTGRGRRINNSEPDWAQTLEGRPRAGYEFWRSPSAARLPSQGSGPGVPRWDAWRYRFLSHLVAKKSSPTWRA
jgi:hypothetical protein